MSRVKISDGSSAPKKEPKESKLKTTHKAAIDIVAGVIALCVCAVGFMKDYKSLDEQRAYTIAAEEAASLFQSARDAAE